jgi:hypothetical protein
VFVREVNPSRVTEADIVVFIPSCGEADSVAVPTRAADLGLIKYFAHKKAVIINCDNHSEDGTREVFINVPTKVPKVHICTEPGVKGKGNVFRCLFQKVEELKASAVIVVGADTVSLWRPSMQAINARVALPPALPIP